MNFLVCHLSNYLFFIQGGTKVEVNYETIAEIQVNLADFNHALERDIKPAFGTQEDQYTQYITNGILEWGEPLKDMMAEAKLIINQVSKSKRTPFVTCLLEGTEIGGKIKYVGLVYELVRIFFISVVCLVAAKLHWRHNSRS